MVGVVSLVGLLTSFDDVEEDNNLQFAGCSICDVLPVALEEPCMHLGASCSLLPQIEAFACFDPHVGIAS